jgi:hypothetical protein
VAAQSRYDRIEMRTRSLRAVVVTLLLFTACGASRSSAIMQHDDDRNAFLRAMDGALSSRNSTAILELSDVDEWRRSGRPQPLASALLLPQGPITRLRDLSESETLYKDGSGRQWRLRFKHDIERKKWMAVLSDSPCPRGGMKRGPQWESRPSGPGAERPLSWTPLECWPLPL